MELVETTTINIPTTNESQKRELTKHTTKRTSKNNLTSQL